MTKKPEKSREVRLGLVMYGGVSLAIYINGVAQEFYRVVRGRGIYRLLKTLTDSDIVVDIISGTSAGGINGIYLAYALCNQKEFSGFSRLWRDHGDISLLLRDYKKVGESPSVLDSEGYYQEHLEEAFSTMPRLGSEELEDPSDLKELDLFITGTDVDGTIYTVFDDAGHPIDVKDHRSVFVLKHRRGRKEPFNPVFLGDDPSDPAPEITHKALATLARITSCFPAAFAPVAVKMEEPGDRTVDGKLQMWGKLGKKAIFLDGGVLDNKPFTHTIKEIFYRLSNREVDRRLFYVEPDPERFSKTPQATRPNIFQAVIRSLIGIPGYESICEDLKLLSEHNKKVKAHNRFVSLLQKGAKECIPPDTMAFIQWFKEWEESGATKKYTEWHSRKGCAYRISRLTAFRESVLKQSLGQINRGIGSYRDTKNITEDLYKAFWEMPEADASLLVHFDASFRLRRLFHVDYTCYDLMIDYKNGKREGTLLKNETDPGRNILNAINREIKLLEVLVAATESLFENLPPETDGKSDPEFWSRILWALKRLTNVKGTKGDLLPPGYSNAWEMDEPASWLPQEEITGFNQRLKLRIRAIMQDLQDGILGPIENDQYESIFCQTDLCERRMLARLGDKYGKPEENGLFATLLGTYEDFILIDAQLFPLELFGNIAEKDVIETVRISPVDAQKGFSRKKSEHKVSGDVMAHFGGFFKKSWRSNDILWGRLDGLCQLVESLMDPERIEKVLENASLRSEIRDRLETDLAASVLFPHSSVEKQKLIDDWLAHLVSENPSLRQTSVNDADKLEMLIEAGQMEVLNEDLTKVIEDALEEQAKWNQYRIRKNSKLRMPKYDPGHACFEAGDGDLDPLVISVASEKLARQSMQNIKERGAESDLGHFFTSKYKVGSESLFKDIPPLVLLETASRAVLVLRNCVLEALGSFGEKIQTNGLYKFVNLSLRLFHWIVLYLRKTPSHSKRILAIGISVLSILALLVGIGWWTKIVHPPGIGFQVRWLIVFIVLPILILVLQVYSLFRRFGKN